MIELEELQWHLYAVGWLVGLSSTYVVDLHVRVDVLTDNLTYKRITLRIITPTKTTHIQLNISPTLFIKPSIFFVIGKCFSWSNYS